MIGIPGELYTLTLGKTSNVYVERIGGHWEAWRETYQTGTRRAVSYKIIAKGRTLDYVLKKVKRYLDYIKPNWKD